MVRHCSARRSGLGFALGASLGLLGLAAGSAADEAPPERFDVVVIDAGHGGEDEGARGPRGSLEKQVVLEVARDVGRDLRGRGLRVVMTREEDVFVPLEQRTHIANDARGDLFVSIHANAHRDSGIHGTETFFLSLDASDDAARRLAERENSAFGEAGAMPLSVNDPLVAILGDLIATEHLQESQEFARMTQLRLGGLDRVASRGVKQAPFVVLSGVQMPASLVEIGFITNPRDESGMRSAEGRRSIVHALVDAVLEFGRRYDARRGADARKAGKR